MPITAHDFRTLPTPGALMAFGVPQVDAIASLPTGQATIVMGPAKSGKTATAIATATEFGRRVVYLTFGEDTSERLHQYAEHKREPFETSDRFFYGMVSDLDSFDRAMIEARKWLRWHNGSTFVLLVVEDLGLIQGASHVLDAPVITSYLSQRFTDLLNENSDWTILATSNSVRFPKISSVQQAIELYPGVQITSPVTPPTWEQAPRRWFR